MVAPTEPTNSHIQAVEALKKIPQCQAEAPPAPKAELQMKQQAPDPPAAIPKAPPLARTKVEPREFATEEERLEWEVKEEKRIKHNARVRFDRTFNSCLSDEVANFTKIYNKPCSSHS